MTSKVSPLFYADFEHSQWLIDVRPELPSAQLDGFDISDDQFPSKAWLPRQISLSQLDITKEIPSDLEGMYDLVHVQLFFCVVQKDGPADIIEQLYKLLSASFLQSDRVMLISFIQNPEGISNGSNTTQPHSKSCHRILH